MREDIQTSKMLAVIRNVAADPCTCLKDLQNDLFPVARAHPLCRSCYSRILLIIRNQEILGSTSPLAPLIAAAAQRPGVKGRRK